MNTLGIHSQVECQSEITTSGPSVLKLLKLSCCKYPCKDKHLFLWNDNKASLLEYIKQVQLCVKGQVFHQNGNQLPHVTVKVPDRKHICAQRTNTYGHYYLVLLSGSYIVHVIVLELQHLIKVIIPKKSQNISALKKDTLFPFQGQLAFIPLQNLLNPMILLCRKLPSHSTVTKHSVIIFSDSFAHIFQIK